MGLFYLLSQCDNSAIHNRKLLLSAAIIFSVLKLLLKKVISLSNEGVKPTEIHRRMRVQYGDACLSLQQVYEWTGKFMNGISSVTDCPRPGQAHRVVTPEGIAAGEAIVKENRRVTVNDIAAHLDMSHGSAHHIVHDKKLN